MSHENHLLLQLVDSADTLNRTIRSLADTIDSNVNLNTTNLEKLTTKFNTSIKLLQDSIATKLPILPNLLYDTTYFDYYCKTQKNTWYDWCLPLERDLFVQNLPVNTNNINITKSSVKVKVIDRIIGIDDTGISHNGQLAVMDTNNRVYPYFKSMLVFDITLFKLEKNINSVFSIQNILNYDPTMINHVKFSTFFNIVKSSIPQTLLTGNSATVSLAHDKTSKNIIFNANSKDNIQYINFVNTDKLAVQKEIDRSIDYATWFHTASFHKTATSVYLPHIELIGNQWIDEPFKITIAFTLPYLGHGGASLLPTWVSELAPPSVTNINGNISYPNNEL